MASIRHTLLLFQTYLSRILPRFATEMQILFGVTKTIKAINMSTHFALIANDLFTCAT